MIGNGQPFFCPSQCLPYNSTVHCLMRERLRSNDFCENLGSKVNMSSFEEGLGRGHARWRCPLCLTSKVVPIHSTAWRSRRSIGLGFTRRGKNTYHRSFPTLESLDVVIGLELLNGTPTSECRAKIQQMPTWTDYRGNRAALNK